MFFVHFCPTGTLYFQLGQKNDGQNWTKMDKKFQKIHGNKALLLLFYIDVDNSVRGSLRMSLVFIINYMSVCPLDMI